MGSGQAGQGSQSNLSVHEVSGSVWRPMPGSRGLPAAHGRGAGKLPSLLHCPGRPHKEASACCQEEQAATAAPLSSSQSKPTRKRGVWRWRPLDVSEKAVGCEGRRAPNLEWFLDRRHLRSLRSVSGPHLPRTQAAWLSLGSGWLMTFFSPMWLHCGRLAGFVAKSLVTSPSLHWMKAPLGGPCLLSQDAAEGGAAVAGSVLASPEPAASTARGHPALASQPALSPPPSHHPRVLSPGKVLLQSLASGSGFQGSQG